MERERKKIRWLCPSLNVFFFFCVTFCFILFFYEDDTSEQICRAIHVLGNLRLSQSGLYFESCSKPQRSLPYSDEGVGTTRLVFRRECLSRTPTLPPKNVYVYKFIYIYTGIQVQPLC